LHIAPPSPLHRCCYPARRLFLSYNLTILYSIVRSEGPRMPAIVDYPQVVKEALVQFGDLLANEPQRRHFADYLTGLYVVATKNVSEISREFPFGTDQS